MLINEENDEIELIYEHSYGDEYLLGACIKIFQHQKNLLDMIKYKF